MFPVPFCIDILLYSSISSHSPSPKPTPHGHVIACRVTAENPDEVSYSHTILALSIRGSITYNLLIYYVFCVKSTTFSSKVEVLITTVVNPVFWGDRELIYVYANTVSVEGVPPPSKFELSMTTVAAVASPVSSIVSTRQ